MYKLISLCFCSIGLQRSVAKFFIFFLTLALTTIAGAALAFTFSAMVSVFAVANLLVALVFILYMVCKHAGLLQSQCYVKYYCYSCLVDLLLA